MVGIPGRSQGCHTCRRRRLKCSLEQPVCERCIKAGRECEGYARRAVFINRTSQGILKRHPFEETLPRISLDETSPDPNPRQISTIPMQLHPSQAFQNHYEGVFLDSYLAQGSTSEWPSPGQYVVEVLALPRDWVLEAAVSALCITRVGRRFSDVNLVRQGFQFYGRALARLRYAIMRQEKAIEDSTFAAAKILNLYEVYEPTHKLVTSLFNHTRGLSTLSQIRGLNGTRSKIAGLILQASRYNAMIALIQDLQSSPLAGKEWRTNSCSTITDFEQRLVDTGFDIGDLVQGIVNICAMHSTNDLDDTSLEISSIRDIASKFVVVENDLSSWLSSFTLWMPTPACWKSDRFAQVPYHSGLALDFSHIRVAHILMDFWSLQIVFAVTLAKLSYLIDQRIPAGYTRNNTPDLAKIYSLSSEYNDAAQIRFASYVEASMPYCCQPQMGCVGPQRTMFQIGILVFYYRQINGTGQFAQDKVKQTLETMHRLNKRIGVDFADHSVKDRPLPEWARRIEPDGNILNPETS